jgi:FkbM family methyltransferase
MKQFAYDTVPRILRQSRVLRFLAIAPATLAALMRRRWCWVEFDDGWVHHYRDGVVVRDLVGGPTPADMRAGTRDVCLWSTTPGPGDVVVDAGAGIGEEVVLFAQLVGSRGRVIAIEAHPRTYSLLVHNCRRNGLTNVVPVHAAVLERSGFVRIREDGESTTRSVGETGIEVPATTLAEIMRDHGVDDVALLKMNIEGAEVSALDGLGSRVGNVAAAVVSCHDFLADAGERGDDARTREAVLAFWAAAGYDLAGRPARIDEPWIRDYVYATRRSAPGAAL